MASSKEIQHSSKPANQHRLSMSTNSGSLPRPSSYARNHSHSLSSGSLISKDRVTRRKSITSNGTSTFAAMVAAHRESGDNTLAIPIANRRKSMSRGPRSAIGSLPSPPASLQSHRIRLTSDGKERGESAIEDEIDEDMDGGEEGDFKLNRMRRASEGQHLMKDGKKSNSSDLKCDKCGKGYKHSSCLSKHLWEHSPHWSLTSKLLISKHQQVQLLEAASILVNLNQDSTPPESTKDFQSDQESASPAASGSSEHEDGVNSANTTPPPQADMFNKNGLTSSYGSRHKRHSSGYGFSRSYQSAPSANSNYSGSVPSSSVFSHYRHSSRDRRPSSSGFDVTTEDENEMALAAQLLSCSFGSNGTSRSVVAVTLPEDAPPVPHIPAQYLSQTGYSGAFSGSTLSHSLKPLHQESYTRGERHTDRDVKMDESDQSVADEEDYDQRSRGRSDEDDDGVFGRMEE